MSNLIGMLELIHLCFDIQINIFFILFIYYIGNQKLINTSDSEGVYRLFLRPLLLAIKYRMITKIEWFLCIFKWLTMVTGFIIIIIISR